MSVFEKKDDFIVLNAPYAEVYIPFSIIGNPDDGNPVAYEYGEGIKTIGLFNIKIFDDEKQPRNSVKLRTFNYPNVITMYPSNKVTETIQLDTDMEPDKYYVLQFYQGDVIMESRIQQSSKNCEMFMNYLIRGKLPKGLKYTDLYFAWIKNFAINAQNPGVPAVTLQTIISENCRSKEDAMKQFRKVVNESGVALTDYKVHNMVDICSNSSVMNALIFERFGDMLTSSLNMSKSGVTQNTSPLEKVLTM